MRRSILLVGMGGFLGGLVGGQQGGGWSAIDPGRIQVVPAQPRDAGVY